MQFQPPGHFRDASALRDRLRELGATFDLDPILDPAGFTSPLELFGRSLGNRFCTQPMEGWDGTAAGGPTAHTLRRWRNFGRSGADLIYGGEAFAVRPDGRANPHQLHLGPDSERQLRELLAEVAAGSAETGGGEPLIGLQLTHSGRFARPDGPLAPRIAQHHPLLAQKYSLAADLPLLTDGELEAIGECYVDAAVVAQRAGFHFVDVKCCHGYLLHEVLASKTRAGSYGGSLAHRMRLFERIVAAIRAACPGLGIAVRLSAADTVPFEADPDTRIGRPMSTPGFDWTQHHFGIAADDPTGFDLTEPIAFCRRLEELDIPLVNVSLGSPYWNPHLQRPASYPPSDGYLPPHDPLLMVDRHLAVVRSLKQACGAMQFVGTGYSLLQEWLPNVAQHALRSGHVDFVGLGRLVLSYAELPRDVIAGRELQRKRICRTFSDCTTGPRNGMLSGCFPLDPYYKAMPEAKKVKDIRNAIAKGPQP
ncbi:MAG: NADH:flavin oxidoreductase [Planctomycetes bacterium]|nr:NADH:flavin oxidoreductase [Planctomycetota bacterium]